MADVDLLPTDLERLILSFSDAEFVSAQPKYAINVSGDDRVLNEQDAVVRQKLLRGRTIEVPPARLISIDRVGDGSVAVVASSGIERLTRRGSGEAPQQTEIPQQTIAALSEHGIEDPENVLWVSNTSPFGAASTTLSATGSLPHRAQGWGRITPSLKNTYHRQRRRKSALVHSRASGGCRWQ